MIYDKDIREPLFDWFEETFGKARVFEEKRTGRARADVVLVTEGNVTGVEIKSDADSYSRLSNQVKEYNKFYTRNIVVVGASHSKHIAEHVPDYWGIVSVSEKDGRLFFEVLREPQDNPKVKLKNTLRLLWRPELALLQEKNKMPKYREKSKEFVITKIAERVPEKIPMETIRDQISDILFERDYTLIQSIIKDFKNSKTQG